MRVAWWENDCLLEESKWESIEDAEQALLLLNEYAIGGELEAVKNLRIVKMGDA